MPVGSGEDSDGADDDGAVDHHGPQVCLRAESGYVGEVCECDVGDREADDGEEDGSFSGRRQSSGDGHGFSWTEFGQSRCPLAVNDDV